MQPDQTTKPKRQTKQWKDMSLGAKIVGVVGLVFIFFIGTAVIAGIISAITHSGNSNNTAKTTPTNNSQQTQSQPTQPTAAQQVATWSGKYSAIFSTLANDASHISNDGKNVDSTSMNSDCMQLKTDVSTAQSYPAIPDPQSASDWSSALSYFADAAQDCIDGTANLDASLLSKSASELNKGTDKTLATNDDIKALTATQ